jgi:hypothetical protein
MFKKYQQTRARLTAPESHATLDAMERFFQGGANWVQGAYHWRGKACLVGAAQSVHVAPVDSAQHYLRLALAESGHYAGPMGIEAFNDSRASYSEVAALVARAKELAAANSPQRTVGQILPPRSRPALTYQPGEQVKVITLADMERVASKRR